MDFLGIGFPEFLLILLIIILVIGPRDIGKTARSIGRFLNRLYKSEEWKAVTEASKTLRTLPNRLAREAEIEEIEEMRKSLAETKGELEEARKDFEKDARSLSSIQDELVREARQAQGDLGAWNPPPKSDGEGSQTCAPADLDKPEDDPSPEEISDSEDDE
jgi:Sec-independent protein translocase protein TatA